MYDRQPPSRNRGPQHHPARSAKRPERDPRRDAPPTDRNPVNAGTYRDGVTYTHAEATTRKYTVAQAMDAAATAFHTRFHFRPQVPTELSEELVATTLARKDLLTLPELNELGVDYFHRLARANNAEIQARRKF